jgi:hypothetical protein
MRAKAWALGTRKMASMSAARATIDRLTPRTTGLIADRLPILAVVVWRSPDETEAEAIERYMREHPETAARPAASLTLHVVS